MASQEPKDARPVEPRDMTPALEQRQEATASEETKLYVAWVRDPQNDDEVKKTEEEIRKWVKEPDRVHYIMTTPDFELGKDPAEIRKRQKIAAWAGVTLNQTAHDELKKHPGISELETETGTAFFRATPSLMPQAQKLPTSLFEDVEPNLKQHVKRADLEWAKQESASGDLREISRWDGAPPVGQTSDFVHEKRAGEGVVVYVVEGGVELHVKNDKQEEEFLHWEFNEEENKGIVTTPEFRKAFPDKQDWKKDNNHFTIGHGTEVASKAVGKTSGVAKGATLVPVQCDIDHFSDYIEGFNEIGFDIMTRLLDGRSDLDTKYVVVFSVGENNKIRTHEEAKASDRGKRFLQAADKLFDLGVPIVLASGNLGKTRPKIDYLPQVLASDDYPFINVGAAAKDGSPWEKTQGQGTDLLHIYARGVQAQVHNHKDGKPHYITGTSVAAPAVAGLIATYSNYEPWGAGKKGKERVQAIKKYLQTKESSWEHNPGSGVFMIWNGADENAHKSVDAHKMCKRADEVLSDVDPELEMCKPGSPPPESPKEKEGRTLWVGMEQVVHQKCWRDCGTTCMRPAGGSYSEKCDEPTTKNTYIFFTGEHTDDPGSLCNPQLNELTQYDIQDNVRPGRKEEMDNPSWPGGDYPIHIFGADMSFKSDGNNAGALWYGDKLVASCGGNKDNHDPKQDEWCRGEDKLKTDGTMRRRRVVGCEW